MYFAAPHIRCAATAFFFLLSSLYYFYFIALNCFIFIGFLSHQAMNFLRNKVYTFFFFLATQYVGS